jgi:hypothetical protein
VNEEPTTIGLLILGRDRYRCVRCGVEVGQWWPGYSVHHRVLGNRDDMRPCNLITLCGSGTTGCHGWVHNHPKLSRDEGWIVSKYDDPAGAYVRIHGLGLRWLDDSYGMRETATAA